MRSLLLAEGGPLRTTHAADEIRVESERGLEATFRLVQPEGPGGTGTLCLLDAAAGAAHGGARLCGALFAALESAFAQPGPWPDAVALDDATLGALGPALEASGLVPAGGPPRIDAATLFAHRPGWMPGPPAPDEPAGRAPPAAAGLPPRPPMPTGTLYARHIPWLGRTLRFDVATTDDLPRLHRWLNDPVVDRFWRESGPLEAHRAYLRRQFDDPHTIPLIGRLGGTAFAYFEIYWAAESVIGPHYAADPFDRGWHVLVGEADHRGRAFITAWLPSLMHLLFLDEPRTRRIVGEPDAAHEQQLRNLARSGFEHFATVELPTKRAALVALSRERFLAGRPWRAAG